MDVFEYKPLELDGEIPDLQHIVAYSRVDGGYVGTIEFAAKLEKRGICPQRASLDHSTCSIGYCLDEDAWYGWSHRAMYGFKIGSEVKKGDCAYVPTDWKDFAKDCIRFWSDNGEHSHKTERKKDEDGREFLEVSWIRSSNPEQVPNEKVRGQPSSVRSYPPDFWGNGEWRAKTAQDAKQMAIDFARGVS